MTLDLKRSLSRAALSGGHRRTPLDASKKSFSHIKDIFYIPYTRCVYQCGEYENSSTPKLVPELMDSTSDIGRIIYIECIAQCCFLVFSESGKVYTFGKDRLGGLGHGPDVKQLDQPRVIEALENIPVSKIFSGFGQAAAVTDSGKLYIWGNGKFSPVLTELPNAFLRVVQVALGSSHVAVRVQSGDVYTWGSNVVGQLGLGITAESVTQPTKVSGLPPVIDIKAAYVHLLALTTKRELYVWGRNTLVLPDQSIPILYEGQPDNIRAPCLVEFEGNGQISRIGCGHEFNVVLTDDGKVWTWGRAKCGCLGNGSEETHCAVPTVVEALKDIKIDNISCGIRHAAAWTSSGAIYTWGYGEKGNLGHGDYENQLVPKLLQTLPFTQENTPSDGVKAVMCSLSQTFFLWERYSYVEQAIRYLEVHGLHQEGLFRINPSMSEMVELQSKIESGTFVQFPHHAAHLAAGFLARSLKANSTPLLPHSIVELTQNLDGVVDKPLRNLRVLAAIADAVDSATEESRGVLAQFSRFLVELSLHPVTKMTLRNLVICVGSCIFGSVVSNNADAPDLAIIALAQKEAGMVQECGNLLLQNLPTFFDELLSRLLQVSNFVDYLDAPKLLESIVHHEFNQKTRGSAMGLLAHMWANFEPGNMLSSNDSKADYRHSVQARRSLGVGFVEDAYIVPFIDEIPVDKRRDTTLVMLTHLDRMSLDLRTAVTHSEKANSVVSALQQSMKGVDLLLAEITRPLLKTSLSVGSNVGLNDSTLMGILETQISASDATGPRRTDKLPYLGAAGSGVEEIALRRRGEVLEQAKDRLTRELLLVLKDLQSSATQVAAQQKKRDEEASGYLRGLRQHIKDSKAVYSLKTSDTICDILRQLTLPSYYLTGEQPPTARAKSKLGEVFVCLLEILQNEWETTVTALHTTNNSDEAWARVLEVYMWWKGLATLYTWIDSITTVLSAGITACKEYIPAGVLEEQEASMAHIRYVHSETANYIKQTQYSSKAGDYLYEILEQRIPKT